MSGVAGDAGRCCLQVVSLDKSAPIARNMCGFDDFRQDRSLQALASAIDL